MPPALNVVLGNFDLELGQAVTRREQSFLAGVFQQETRASAATLRPPDCGCSVSGVSAARANRWIGSGIACRW